MVFAVCCALRLARFNVGQNAEEEIGQKLETNDFVGVPAPALACLGLSPLFLVMMGIDVSEHYTIVTMIFLVVCGALAVGTFPTISLKDVNFPASMNLPIILTILAILVCLIVFPWETLLIGNVVYLLTLPVFVFIRKSASKLDK